MKEDRKLVGGKPEASQDHNQKNKRKLTENPTPLRTALIYALFSVLWILVSDKALEFLVPSSSPVYVLMQTIKGWLFVLASASLIYLILRREMKYLQEKQKDINYQARLIEDVSDALISIDMQFRVVSWNPAAEQIYGWKAEEVIGHRLDDFVKTEYTNGETDQQALQHLAEKGYWKGEALQPRKDGSYFPVLASVTYVKDENGEKIGLVAVNQDITERKQADEKLWASETRYRQLFEHMNEGYAYCQMIYADEQPQDWVYLMVNESFTKLTGLKNAAGRKASELIPGIRESDPELLEIYGRVAYTGKPEKFEMFVKSLEMWFSISVYCPERGYFAAFFDIITERKRTEDALRESEDKFKYIFDHSIIGKSITLPDGRITVNKAFCEMLGYSEGELINKKWQELTHPDDIEPSSRATQQLLTGEKDSIRFTKRYFHKDGSVVWADFSTSLRWDEQGKPVYFMSALIDITERKRIEAQVNDLLVLNEKVIDNSPIGILTYKLSGECVLANENAAIIAGTSIEKLLKQNFRMIESWKKSGLYDLVEKAIANRVPITSDIHHISTFGKDIWLKANAVTFQSKEEEHVLLTLSDITERKQHERELEALASVSKTLRKARTLDEMLSRLLEQTLALIKVEIGSIWLYDIATDHVNLVIQRGLNEENLITIVRRGEGIPGSVVKSGEAIVSREFFSDPRILEKNRITLPKGLGGACIPLNSDENVVGLIFILVKLPREISAGELHLLNALAEIGGNAIHRMHLLEQTLKQLERLRSLRAIDIAISSSLDLQISLNTVLEEVTAQLKVDAASVLLINPETKRLEFTAGMGFHTNKINSTSLKIGESYAGQVALEKKIVYIKDLNNPDQHFIPSELSKGEGFVSYFGMPLMAKGEAQGVLEIFNRSALHVNMEWLNFMDSLSWQAAIAVENTLLFKNLQRSNSNIESAYNATIEGWSRALDLRDNETEGHSLRVTELTMKLARTVGMNDDQLASVRRGALLHDIGKMGVPDAILFKPGPLSEEEWRIMRKHPQHAYDLLSPISYLHQALDIPYCHHEKWDGTGYPRKLKGEEIPLAVRIFTIVDVWDALTSDRPYRPAWSDTKTIEYIRENSGSHFDPQLVEIFLKNITTVN